MPVGADSYREALRTVAAVYEATAEVLRERGLSVLKADEGGFGPALESHAAALELLDAAVERAGLRIGDDIAYALDVAATHFYDPAAGPTSSPRRAAPAPRRSSRPCSASWPIGTPCCRSRTRWPRTTGRAGRR